MRWSVIAVALALLATSSSAGADELEEREAKMVALVKQGKWKPAMVHARAALGLAKKKLGARHATVARHHTNVADLALRLAKLELAAKHYELAVDIRAETLGANHGNVALTLLSLAETEAALKKNEAAAKHYERALEIFEKALGPDNGYVGRTAYLLGRLRGSMGQHQVAIGLLERSLRITTKVVGADHDATLDTLGLLAWYQRVAGDYAGALAHYKILLERQTRLKPRSEEVAINAINLALVLKKMGKLEEATTKYRAALALLESLHGARHATIATTLDNLANVLRDRGQFREARELLDRAVPMWQKLRGPEHLDTGLSMNALAVLLKDMGDLATALPLARKVVEIFTKSRGRRSEETAVALDNLASILVDLGRYKEAEPLYREAMSIHEARFGREHPRVATGANNIGSLLRSLGKPKESLPFYRRALAINTRRRGAATPAVAANHGQLGIAHLEIGELDEARRHLDRARAINDKVLGDAHPSQAFILSHLAWVEIAAGKPRRARALADRSLDIAERHLEPLLFATSQRERLELVGQHQSELHMYLSLTGAPGDAARAYDRVLRWKAIVLTSMVAQRQALLAQSDKRLGRILARLAKVRTELANLAMAVPEPGERKKVAARLGALGRKKDRLERQLSRRSAAFSAGQRQVSAGFREVCRALPRGAALVDYVRYLRTEKGARRWQVAAFVTTGGSCRRPARIELGPAAAIDKAVRGLRALIENRESSEDIIALGNKVRRLVWDKLKPALGGRDRIWVSTDGSLNGVPFGGLPRGRRFLIEDYTFSYLASGKDLLRPARGKTTRGGRSLLVGGVRYGGGNKSRPRSRGSGCGIQSRPRYTYLPGTKTEAAAIAGLIEGEVTSLTGAKAGEAAIKKLLPKSRIVHLATHGFFARPCSSPGGRVDAGDELASNPLVRSGIVLAGANDTRGSLVVDGDDGVLTAEEVAELDLREVDLAVLSACETGLGDIRDGEGVLGLRWAFEIAGARALVMSLWQVPDAETRQLMEAFYRRLRASPELGPAEALRAAQIEMLAARRRGGDPNPWSWSAFIVSGR
jgi:CHAT domain-containing protein/tetratricopeptide (TPR) repeat protein